MKKNVFLENDISKKTKKVKNIKKLIFFLIAILVIPFFCLNFMQLLKNPSNTYLVVNGNLSQEETHEGYIVREEIIVEGNNSGKNMNKIKQEGERVAKGDTVFRYSSEQEGELKKKISEIDEEIQKILEVDSGNVFSSDKKMIESQIIKEIDKIYKSNEITKISECKNNINTYLSKKARIIGEQNSSNSYLKKLVSDRTSYEEQLNNISEDVKAPNAGVVSYRVDELENVLTTEDMNKLNKDFLEGLNIATRKNVTSSNEKGKIVNNYFCYMLFNSNSEEAKNAKINDKIRIKIDEEEIITTIINIIEENDGSRTIAIKLKNGIENLLDYRKIEFDIVWWSIDGFRIPNTSITETGNIKYVTRNRNGYLNKMPVKILKQGEEYSIVAAYTKKELLDLGLTNDEISNLKTITLYDTIQQNKTK